MSYPYSAQQPQQPGGYDGYMGQGAAAGGFTGSGYLPSGQTDASYYNWLAQQELEQQMAGATASSSQQWETMSEAVMPLDNTIRSGMRVPRMGA